MRTYMENKFVPVQQLGQIYPETTWVQLNALKMVADERVKYYYTRFKNKLMYEVTGCSQDSDIKIIERWTSKDRKKCCAIEFEDKMGLKTRDIVYEQDLIGHKVLTSIFDGDKGLR